MRTILLTASLLVCCDTSIGKPLAVTPNVIGGYTILTDEYCQTNDKYLQAYATDNNDNVTKACWYIKDEDIYFIPKDGKMRRMPLDRFEIIYPKVKIRT
jgi:hypothetical protein